MHTGFNFILRLCINSVIIKVSIIASTDGEIYPSPPEFKINKSKFIIKIEQKITSNPFSNKAHCLCNNVQ